MSRTSRLWKKARRTLWWGGNVVAGLFLLVAGNYLADFCSKVTGGHKSDVPAYALAFWTVGSAAAIGLPLYFSQRERRIIARGECTKAIKRILATLSGCFPEPNRTNIMLVDSTGERRKVDKKTAHNMGDDPDNDLEIDLTAGVSGQAVIERAFVWGDLTLAQPPGSPSWRLRRDEQRRVRPDLKTIVSVPIVDPENPLGPVLGTLQIDSDLLAKDFIPKEKAAGNIALRFADVIALLLKERS